MEPRTPPEIQGPAALPGEHSEAVLADYPQIADLLAPVFAKLDLATLQDLNGRGQVGGEPAAAVATDFLSRAGLAK